MYYYMYILVNEHLTWMTSSAWFAYTSRYSYIIYTWERRCLCHKNTNQACQKSDEFKSHYFWTASQVFILPHSHITPNTIGQYFKFYIAHKIHVHKCQEILPSNLSYMYLVFAIWHINSETICVYLLWAGMSIQHRLAGQVSLLKLSDWLSWNRELRVVCILFTCTCNQSQIPFQSGLCRLIIVFK